MRPSRGASGGSRANALWGTGGRGGESRPRGRRGRALVVLFFCFALALPVAAAAGRGSGGRDTTFVAPGVLQAARAHPKGKVRVIIQSAFGSAAAKRVAKAAGGDADELGIIGGAVAEIPAAALNGLAKASGLIVTLDAPMKAAASPYTSDQLWPHENGVSKLWGTEKDPAPQAPTIAIVDSGIDSTQPSFGDGSRIIRRLVFTRLPQNPSLRDGRGHGTFVAGLAAGQAAGYAGASPTSKLVDLDVMDDRGMANTSDIIRAADWILANKDTYGIRVVNFSLHSTAVLSIQLHPLNRAVEKLWTSGVVVVAAAGNYGTRDGPSGVVHAPGNDPLVITVGGLDMNGTAKVSDDSVAPWSAYGYTLEGFAKPEIVAAGRYMVGPVPAAATLLAERPDSVVAPGYMQMSGTSFSSAVVSGVVAQLLARHPDWTPDNVKGALMQSARKVGDAPQLAQGFGQVNTVKGWLLKSVARGNGALAPFLGPDPDGSPGHVINAAAWFDAMKADAAWDSAAWAEAAWADAAVDRAWFDSLWSEAAFNDAAWADGVWLDSDALEDYAVADGTAPEQLLTPEEEAAIAADPDLAVPSELVLPLDG